MKVRKKWSLLQIVALGENECLTKSKLQPTKVADVRVLAGSSNCIECSCFVLFDIFAKDCNAQHWPASEVVVEGAGDYNRQIGLEIQ